MNRIIALALALVLLLTGCSWNEPAYVVPGDLTDNSGATEDGAAEDTQRALALTYYPNRSLNPYHCTDYTNRLLFSLIYQGLFAVDRDYNVSPVLCSSYTVSMDMQTWTFHLAAATFSDGTAVTPEDVRASLQSSMGSAWYGNRLQHVQSISIVGDAVVLQLDTPCENLPILLDIPIVKAAQVGDTHPIGTGPYRLDGAQLKRQAAWWCSAQLSISAQTIPLVEATGADQIRDNLESFDIGLVCADPGDQDYADFRRDYELWNCENGLFMYLMVSEKSELFKNDSIRTALTHVIDRDTLISDHYHGLARSATLPASPQSPYYSSKLAANFGYDPEKFSQAVAAAQAQGSEITLMVCSADLNRTKVARDIADALRSSGLAVTLKTVSSAELVSELRWGTYDLFLGQTRLSANMDLSAFFDQNGALNYGGLADVTTYGMCLKALANDGNYYSLHKMVMEAGWLCPVMFQSYAIYGSRGVAPGLTPARDNIFYYDLGITMDEIKAQ